EPERTAVGAALTASVATGLSAGYVEIGRRRPLATLVTEPNREHRNLYGENYQRFVALYPALRPLVG
ncbi:MAG: hypothetical protein R3300_17955, partial [Candidatus Promineifilaceae bacterium]|nr:hypothetical protein [Candidatus Promineifilaceae bacterium]